MKKFLFILFGVFVVMGAFAAGENTPTSKSYVDAVVAQKQDKISASIIMPAGYTALEYIESTGTQYIDTGVAFNSDIGYELEYQPKTTNNFVVQAGTTGQVIAQLGNVWEFRFNGSINRRPSPSGIDLTQFVNIKYNIDNKCSVDNRIVYIGDLTLNAGGSIRLFGPNWRSSGRMSFFLIYDNGVLVNNLVPARRNSDGVLGMYDMVTGQFFTNSGTGEFIAGPVIIPGNQVLTNTGTAGEYGTKGIYNATGEYATQQNALIDAITMNTAVQNAIDSEFQCIEYDENNECLLLQIGGITQVLAGYTQLEYLESTGSQWIDTGVSPTNTTGLRVKFNRQTNGDQVVVGVLTDEPYRGQIDVNPWNDRLTMPFAQSFSGGICGQTINKIDYEVSINYKNNRKRYVNGISVLDIYNTLIAHDDTIYAFAAHYVRNGTNRPSHHFRGRIYYLQITEGMNTVRNFIPARRNSDGEIGMYDTVTNTFFTNAGTGEFIAGPIVYLPTGE